MLALLATAPALAAAREPTPQPLWRSYPLDPAPRQPPRTATAATVPTAARSRPRPVPVPSSSHRVLGVETVGIATLLGLLVVGGGLAFARAVSRRRGGRSAGSGSAPPTDEEPDELVILREKLARSGSEVDALKTKLAYEPRPQDVDVLKAKGIDGDLDAVHLLLAKLDPPGPRPQLRALPNPTKAPRTTNGRSSAKANTTTTTKGS